MERATTVLVRGADGEKRVIVDQKKPATIENRWVSLGAHRFTAGRVSAVVVDAANANGNVHIDAVQVLPAK